jgi:hypothetical protein
MSGRLSERWFETVSSRRRGWMCMCAPQRKGPGRRERANMRAGPMGAQVAVLFSMVLVRHAAKVGGSGGASSRWILWVQVRTR